jgi:hypothetical protein
MGIVYQNILNIVRTHQQQFPHNRKSFYGRKTEGMKHLLQLSYELFPFESGQLKNTTEINQSRPCARFQYNIKQGPNVFL